MWVGVPPLFITHGAGHAQGAMTGRGAAPAPGKEEIWGRGLCEARVPPSRRRVPFWGRKGVEAWETEAEGRW